MTLSVNEAYDVELCVYRWRGPGLVVNATKPHSLKLVATAATFLAHLTAVYDMIDMMIL